MHRTWTIPALFLTASIVACSPAAQPEQGATDAGGPAAAAESASAPAATSQSAPAASATPAAQPRATTGSQAAAPPPATRPDVQPNSTPEAVSTTPAPAEPPAPEWRELTLPAGTALPLELTTALSSETAKVETAVRARLRQAVVVNGYTALPVGTVVTGGVTSVERAGRVQGRAHVTFAFSEAMVDGEREALRTEPITYEAEATKGEDATKVGAGAGVGAVIGGILGGGKGAAKGAAIGGAAGAGTVLATRGKEVEVASGTSLTSTLTAPLTVRIPFK